MKDYFFTTTKKEIENNPDWKFQPDASLKSAIGYLWLNPTEALANEIASCKIPEKPCEEDTGLRGWLPGFNDSKCKPSSIRGGTATVTWLNRSGKTLHIYFAIAGQSGIHCDNLAYAGKLVNGERWSRSVKYGEWGWFKFQEDQSTAGCGLRNNKLESRVGGAVGGDKSETINIF